MGSGTMRNTALDFTRPDSLQATAPPEARGVDRDGVRLLVSTPREHTHAQFRDLPRFLQAGDLLVVNRSATLPASLPAEGSVGRFVLNLSTRFGDRLWVAEPRWSLSTPGPLPLEAGDELTVAGAPARLVKPYPGLPRLWFVRIDGDVDGLFDCCGTPIRYGYVVPRHGGNGKTSYPLDTYQTVFATVPGSAEMPSAGRPFTPRIVDDLRARGIEIAGIVLHAGVSSLEVEAERVEDQTMYAEPFRVPAPTAHAVNAAMREGRRIIAVGTTVVRAVESAWDSETGQVHAAAGFTRLYIHPGRSVNVINGLLTGFHDPLASHLAMLYAIAGREMVQSAYEEAVLEGYLWHEFGDSHLILP